MSLGPADIRVQGVTKHYGDRTAVDRIDLELRPGRITALLGPSGCGKSTLLRLIAGLEVPDDGRILAGETMLAGPATFVPPERRSVGLVFQDYALFPHLDVLENVMFGLRGRPAAERRRRALALLDQLRLGSRTRDWPHTLSGGEQQRAALARALARDPAVVLMDEPFSGLDPHLRAEVRATVLSALREADAAVLIVTHDAEDALLMADDLVLMSRGAVIQRGTPRDCYLNPISREAAGMLGDVNAVPTTVRDGQARTPFGTASAPGIADGDAFLLVRPETLTLAATGVSAKVVAARFAGAMNELVLDIDGLALRLRTQGAPSGPGTQVTVALDVDRARVVPSSSLDRV
ncbi:ABC transporter ATP-binding protein [Phenylobacterium sp.]|uniref:ABC transporter ATP-binding protein n=1 Tax=Phenylobacterium sp. TaxID=1871053 RepID=UPI00301BE54B